MAEDVARVAGYGALHGSVADDAPRERYNSLRSSYEQRLRGLVGQLKETLLRVQGDPTLRALSSDATTAEFAAVCVRRALEFPNWWNRTAAVPLLATSCERLMQSSLQRHPISCMCRFLALQVRVDEVIDATLAAEREATITRLMEAVAVKDAELKGLHRYVCSFVPYCW